MATTATITLTSADIAGDPVNVSKTSTCTKAGTTTDLDQTTGLNRVHLRSTTNKVLLAANAEGNNLAAKVYIINKFFVELILLRKSNTFRRIRKNYKKFFRSAYFTMSILPRFSLYRSV